MKYPTALAAFRGETARGISTQGTTCEQALRNLKQFILARHCPRCGALLKEATDGQ